MHRFAPIILTLLAVMLMFFTMTGSRGYLHLREIRNETMRLKEKNRQLEEEIAATSGDLHAVQTNDFELEKKAREELGLSRSNEIIYIFSDTTKKK